MKIIRLTTLLDFGGQEKQYISFGNQKDILKHEYTFAAIGYGGFAEKQLVNKGFRVKIFNSNPAISNIRNIVMLYKWFKMEKPDIVHTAAAEANLHGIIAARLAGVKTIIAEEIGFPTHSSKARTVFRYLYHHATKVICVSVAVKNFLVGIKEISDEKGTVIYNPVTQPIRVEKNRSEEFTIVSVGRLESVKNQKLLIESLPKLGKKNIKLVLVGEGRERKNLERLILERGLINRVEITGFVPNPEMWLAKADLFVLPSYSEGFGIAAVEAMQMGIPCLCSNVGGIPEFIQENETGWLFDPKNLDELVEKLSKILDMNTESRERIGLQGKNSVFSRFSEEKYAVTLENFYEKISQ